MKRYLFVALLVLAISAVAVMPAFAMDDCASMTGMSGYHDLTVASLILHVQHAADPMMRHVDPTLVTALSAPLNTAANIQLPLTSRVGALQAFINLVNAQTGKGIAPDCATMLTGQAQGIIDLLLKQG